MLVEYQEKQNKRIILTNSQRMRIAAKAERLSRKMLERCIELFTADTVMRWYNKLIAEKYDGSCNRGKVGRPNIDWQLIKLIRKMQKENLTWSAQRIQGELAKLGFSVCDNTVAKYMKKPKTDPEKIQRWLTFLRNHAKYTVGIEFLVVRTISFKALYVFVAISHDRCKILHFGISSAMQQTCRKSVLTVP